MHDLARVDVAHERRAVVRGATGEDEKSNEKTEANGHSEASG